MEDLAGRSGSLLTHPSDCHSGPDLPPQAHGSCAAPLPQTPSDRPTFSFFGFNLEPQGLHPSPASTKAKGPALNNAELYKQGDNREGCTPAAGFRGGG